jgi:hypothetical protein
LKLWKASNDHHEAILEYLDTHGVDDKFIVAIKAKVWFLDKIAEKYDIDLNII